MFNRSQISIYKTMEEIRKSFIDPDRKPTNAGSFNINDISKLPAEK